MKKLILAVVIALASGSALAQAPAPVQPHRLTGAEIRTAYVGNMAYGFGRFGPKTITTYFAPDGQVRARSPDGSDTGTYRITDDDMYCSKYRKLRDGVETCQTIWQTGPNTYEAHLPNGSVVKVTIVAGNPEGL
jgi:hypothetical protein